MPQNGSRTSSLTLLGKLSPVANALLSNSRMNLVVLSAFAANLILLFPVFFPNLRDITGFAEAAYINNGKRLVEGVMTPFGYSPLSSFLYAATYLPVQGSPYWLIYSCTIGRFLLFGLLWGSSYLVAKTQSALASPFVMIMFLLVSQTLVHLIAHGSHALFAAMSAFALWQVLSFYETKRISHLTTASVFIGLAVLARSGEGLILFLVLLLLLPFLKGGLKTKTAYLSAALLPCAAIVLGYIVAYRLLVGSFDLGMAEYSYFTFEQGHGMAFQSEYDENEEFYVLGQMDARRLFGTPQENQYSIATAILRNPKAYLERVPRLIGLIPGYVIIMYASLGVVFFLITARGIIELIRRRLYLLLSIFLLWCSYLLVYAVLVFQPRHFLLPYYAVFLLSSVGLTALVDNFHSRKERYLWALALVVLMIIALTVGRAKTFATAGLVLLVFGIAWMTMHRYRTVQPIKAIGVMLASAPFILGAQYPEPRFRNIGIAADERATLFMRERLPPGAPVGAYQPINPWMANLTYIPMYRSSLPQFRSQEDFGKWMKENRLHAIYADIYLKKLEPAVWQLVQERIGQDLRVGFVSEDENIHVLLTATDSPLDLAGYVDRPWYSSQPRFRSSAAADP
jgi:hypothetical protein